MKLKIGKKYVTRNGYVVRVISYEFTYYHAKIVEPKEYLGSGYAVNDMGRYHLNLDEEHVMDIVEEYKEPEPEPEINLPKRNLAALVYSKFSLFDLYEI